MGFLGILQMVFHLDSYGQPWKKIACVTRLRGIGGRQRQCECADEHRRRESDRRAQLRVPGPAPAVPHTGFLAIGGGVRQPFKGNATNLPSRSQGCSLRVWTSQNYVLNRNNPPVKG